MSGELVEWLRAQLDEDERVARAAAEEGRRWQLGGGSTSASVWADDAPDPVFPVVYDEGRPTRAQAEHIARWDPARALREVAASRALLDLHLPVAGVNVNSTSYYVEEACSECGYSDEYAVTWPCDTVRLLAAVYADQPGYREEWRP